MRLARARVPCRELALAGRPSPAWPGLSRARPRYQAEPPAWAISPCPPGIQLAQYCHHLVGLGQGLVRASSKVSGASSALGIDVANAGARQGRSAGPGNNKFEPRSAMEHAPERNGPSVPNPMFSLFTTTAGYRRRCCSKGTVSERRRQKPDPFSLGKWQFETPGRRVARLCREE